MSDDDLFIPTVKFATRTPKLRKMVFLVPKRVSRYPKTQKHLKALRAHAVPAGKVLNPYGTLGLYKRSRKRKRLGVRVSWREEAVKRKRLKLKVQRQVVLEMHELQELARQNARLAMQTLISISANPRAPEATRIAASAVILDRGYGKASQTSITANVSHGKTSEITSDELDKRVNQALKRVEELTNRTPKTGPSQKGPVDLRKYN